MPMFWRLRAKLHNWFSKVLGLVILLFLVAAVIWGKDIVVSMWKVVESYM